MAKKTSDLRVAIIHDWFWSMKGAEKCAEALCELYPQADVYSLFGDMNRISPSIKKHKITFSILQKIPFIKHIYRYTYFLWPLAIEEFNLKDYDLVISSSSSVAKGVITDYKTLHICYMHSPMRYAWDQTHDYFNPQNFSLWKRLVIPLFLNYLRIWDVTACERVDLLIANSKFTAGRIKKYYLQDADVVVYPPVEIEQAQDSKRRGDYFVASPFDPNKGGRLIVDSAMRYGFKLKLYGTGPLSKELRKKARNHSNIEFLGWISDEERWKLLSKAKGYIYAGVEDLGIIPIEAMASGTPVIAYAKGGVLETVIDGKTGILFKDHTSTSLYEAILKLENTRFNKVVLKKHARRFSKKRYLKEIDELIGKGLRSFLIA